MKFSNPTKRKVYLRCPRRYYYRYHHVPVSAAEAEEHAQRSQLYGIRELGGHLVHRALAEMTNAIAAGVSPWDYAAASAKCVKEFRLIAAKSLALEPGQWESGLQLAETFNGLKAQQIEDDLRYWIDCIPTLIENGYRVALTMGIRQSSSTYSVQAEKRVAWKSSMGTHRFVLDVVTSSRYQTVCIDWKSHMIDNTDVSQVRLYLRYLDKHEGVPASRLFGFAVDLLREEIVEVKYDTLPSIYSVRSLVLATGPAGRPPAFPAKAHPEICVRCPYATQCPAAILPII